MDVERIVSKDPEVVSGELVFAGTRVPVQTLVDYIADGDGFEDFLVGFPTVSREQAVAYLQMTPGAVKRVPSLARGDVRHPAGVTAPPPL